MDTEIHIEPMRPHDWTTVRVIYLEGIATGDATFEQTAPDWEKWDGGHLPRARIVARLEGDVVGWAALSGVSSRCVYAGVAEVSIYVAQRARGRGVGRQLMAGLIAESEATNIWTLQAGIFPENVASIALPQRAGFRIVGQRQRLGQSGRSAIARLFALAQLAEVVGDCVGVARRHGFRTGAAHLIGVLLFQLAAQVKFQTFHFRQHFVA
jgi:L-amino acid N-acyltransferase YncA